MAGQNDWRTKSFGQALLLFPLAADARRLLGRPGRSKHTGNPKENVEAASSAHHSTGNDHHVDTSGTSLAILLDNPLPALPDEIIVPAYHAVF